MCLRKNNCFQPRVDPEPEPETRAPPRSNVRPSPATTIFELSRHVPALEGSCSCSCSGSSAQPEDVRRGRDGRCNLTNRHGARRPNAHAHANSRRRTHDAHASVQSHGVRNETVQRGRGRVLQGKPGEVRNCLCCSLRHLICTLCLTTLIDFRPRTHVLNTHSTHISCLKIAPETAIKLTMYDSLKTHVLDWRRQQQQLAYESHVASIQHTSLPPIYCGPVLNAVNRSQEGSPSLGLH